MKHYFNDDRTDKGIEGYWYIEDGKMIAYVYPTNSREDWLSNFTAFPVYSIFTRCFVHFGYYRYAIWLADFISIKAIENNIDYRDITLFGYSMGGGIAQIVGADIPIRVISIDGARTTSKVNDMMKLLYNKGSLVYNIPFWFKKIKNRECLNDTYRPFWISHADYDVDQIIEDNK